MSKQNSRWRDFHVACQEPHAILRCLNRQDELRRLIEWADNNRLPGPHRAYLIKLNDTQHTLFRYTVSSPRPVVLARLLHGFKSLLTPTPRYLPRGSASIYRQANA